MADSNRQLAADVRALGRIAVLAGGASAERDISLKSGNAVLHALQSLDADVTLVDPSTESLDVIKTYDICFVALHGRGGEDGVIQGALEFAGVPYTGSGVMASAIGMDKSRTKFIWRGAGLPTPAFYVDGRESISLPFPVMVKAAHEGSSIGMYKADDADQLAAAIADARTHDDVVMVERWIDGPEFTVAVLGDLALPPIRLETPNSFYDYHAKYEATTTQYLCPCGLAQDEEHALKRLALDAFAAVGCSGWGRVDVMQDANGEFSLLEVNTVPGMTDHSLVPMAAQAAGMDFAELVARILLLAGGHKR